MDVDFGTSLIMLLRWLGSVALIVGGIATVALLVDWSRGASRRQSSGGRTSATVSSLDAARAGRANDSDEVQVA